MTVMMPKKQQDPLEGSLGTIGSLAGTAIGSIYGGPAGGAAGGAIGGEIGGAAGSDSQKNVSAVGAADRRMQRLNSRQEFEAAQQSLQNIDDPELRSVAEPIIQEALKRSDMEEQKRQSLRKERLNGF